MQRHIYILFILIHILAACTGERDSAPQPEPQLHNVSLTFRIESPGLPSTRAYEGFDDGVAGESYIDFVTRDFRVYFFEGTTAAGQAPRHISTLRDAAISPGTIQPDGSRRYMLTGHADNLPSEGNVRVAVLANWTTYPQPDAGYTLDDLWQDQAGVMTRPAKTAAGAGDDRFLMPFYGIKSVAVGSGDVPKLDAGEVSLIRALAKVTVSTRPETAYPLESVWLVNGNSHGHMAPAKVWDQEDYIKHPSSLNWTTPINIPDVEQDKADMPFGTVTAADCSQTFVIYVPEALVADADPASRPKLRLKFGQALDGSATTGGEHYVDFRDYSASASLYYDLRRNWWFDFTVTKSGPIDLDVDLEPYREVVLAPNFGFDRDEEGHMIITFPASPLDHHQVINDHDGLGIYIVIAHTKVYLTIDAMGYMKFHVIEDGVNVPLEVMRDPTGGLYIVVKRVAFYIE